MLEIAIEAGAEGRVDEEITTSLKLEDLAEVAK